MKKVINTILSSGGGSRGITYIGVFKYIEELIKLRNESKTPDNCILIDIKVLSGVSVGTIFNLVYLLGYTSDEMKNVIFDKKLENLKDIKFLNFISKFGLDSGDKIIRWLHGLMSSKGFDPNITFSEMYIKTKIDYQVLATNLNKYSFTKFSNLDTPNVKITDAIRMSIGVPLVFTIVKYNTETQIVGNGDTHVDGGLIDSFPIHLFKDSLDTTLGLKLINNGEMDHHVVEADTEELENYMYHVLACFMVQRDRRITTTGVYNDHTVYIDTKDLTQTINFSLSKIDKERLVEMGYAATKEFFNRV